MGFVRTQEEIARIRATLSEPRFNKQEEQT